MKNTDNLGKSHMMLAGTTDAVQRPRILVAIPYSSTIGFAIGRLIGTFFNASVKAAGSAEHVHFCFNDTTEGPCRFLPIDYPRVLGADFAKGSRKDRALLEEYISANRIDTVFALDLSVQAKSLAFVRRAGVRTVISYWGAPMSSKNHGWRRFAKKMEVRWLRPHRPDLFIFESYAMQELAVLGRGISASDTTVIRTGVDTETFRPIPDSKDAVCSLFKIPRDRRIVVFMGHMHERKGVHVLLEAANRIVAQKNRPDIHFLFLGNREGEAEQFRKYFGAAVDRGFVTFGGYQTDIPTILSGCDVGCIPSTGWDSYPMSSLEMQACGLPVVVSDLQGVPETFEEGKSGVSVRASDPNALADALFELCIDSERRERMSQYARERIASKLTVLHQTSGLSEAILRAYASSRRDRGT